MTAWRLPDVPPCEVPDCRECAALAAAIDADSAARHALAEAAVVVAAAARRVDSAHGLPSIRDSKETT